MKRRRVDPELRRLRRSAAWLGGYSVTLSCRALAEELIDFRCRGAVPSAEWLRQLESLPIERWKALELIGLEVELIGDDLRQWWRWRWLELLIGDGR